MALTIDSLTGYRTATNTPPYRIVAQGTAHCDQATSVVVQFDREIAADGATRFEVPIVDHHWTVDVAPVSPILQCGDTPKITVSCVGSDRRCPPINDQLVTLRCVVGARPECPTVDPAIVEIGACDTDGKHSVTIRATVSDASPNTLVQWEFGDTAAPDARSGAAVISGAGSLEATHIYAPGTYQARLVVLLPEGCEGTPLDIGPLDSCEPVCPALTPKIAAIGDCDTSGRRLVTVGVSVTGAPSGTLLQVDFGDGTFSETMAVSGNQTRSFAPHPYTPPGPFHARVLVVQPQGCAGSPFDIPALDVCPTQQGPGHTHDGETTTTTTTTPTTTGPSSLCRALEFNWMLWLLVGIVCGILALCAASEGSIIAAIAAEFTEGVGGSVEIIVGYITLFFFLLTVGSIVAALVCWTLWLIFCRPSDCRVWEDLAWVLTWAIFLSGLLSFICPHIGLPVAGVLSIFNLLAQQYIASHRCRLLEPMSAPWQRN